MPIEDLDAISEESLNMHTVVCHMDDDDNTEDDHQKA